MTSTSTANASLSPFYSRELKSASPQVSDHGFRPAKSTDSDYVKPPFLPRLPEKLFAHKLKSSHLINGYYIDLINNNNNHSTNLKVRYSSLTKLSKSLLI